MTNLTLKKEKSSKEMIAEGVGTIPVGWSIMSGTIGEHNEDTFSIMLSGAKLYLSFGKGNRRISLDMRPLLSDAYRLACEDDTDTPKTEEEEKDIYRGFSQGDPIERLDDTPFSQGDPIEKL